MGLGQSSDLCRAFSRAVMDKKSKSHYTSGMVIGGHGDK